MTRRFTGWHMTAIMFAFFGVVVAVNLVMARFAIDTFGGTVVDNSYVASQRYNAWLAEARAQDALGWTLDVSLDDARRVRIGTHAPGGPLVGATVTAVAAHPLGRAPERTLGFASAGEGRYVSDGALPPGRYLLHIVVRSAGDEARFDDEVPA